MGCSYWGRVSGETCKTDLKSHKKIANLQVYISDNCTELEREIIETYWNLKVVEITNNPKECRIKYNLTQYQLNKVINNHSALSFYVYCEYCNSYEKHKVSSISSFNTLINQNNFKCGNCIKQIEAKEKEIREKNRLEALKRFNDAIENKNWKNLSKFELKVLIKSLEMNNYELKSYFGNILGKSNFIQLIKALEEIERQSLLVLTRNRYNKYIENHQYLPKLLEFKNELILELDKIERKAELNKNNVLKLKLTINDNQLLPDSPLYAGTVIFKEKIVIEPNIEYVFGQWPRSDDNLYFTLVPLQNINSLPKQKIISKQPISMQEAIAEFFKKIEND